MTLTSNGLRVQNAQTLKSDQAGRAFAGLPDNVSHHILFSDIFEAARDLGITPLPANFLSDLAKCTKRQDWRAGAKPIVWMSNATLADRHGVDERTISRWLKTLYEKHCIRFNDSGNRKRRGQRHPETGDIVYAFGIDLSPAAALWDMAKEIIQARRAERAEVRTLRSTFYASKNNFKALYVTLEQENASHSVLRRARRVFSMVFDQRLPKSGVDRLVEACERAERAFHILERLCERHLSSAKLASFETFPMSPEDIEAYEAELYANEDAKQSNMSGKHDIDVTQYTNTPSNPLNLYVSGSSEKSRWDKLIKPSGNLGDNPDVPRAQIVYLEDLSDILPINLKMVLRNHLSWQTMERAVWTGLQNARVSEASWHLAIEQLGRKTAIAAAVVMLARDHVTAPEAYLNRLVQKGLHGELNLVASVLKLKAERRVGRYQPEFELA